MKITKEFVFTLLISFVTILSSSPVFSQVIVETEVQKSIVVPSKIITGELYFNNVLIQTVEQPASTLLNRNSLRNFMLDKEHKQVYTQSCTDDLAFFCRLELKMEKQSKLPVKIRLGDVQYVDYLENKREAWRYNY